MGARTATDRNQTVVAIDDDGRILKLIASMLEPSGYRVLATTSPAEGIELVRRENPAVVLCDISMPEMDGYAVHLALQKGEMGVGTFVFLTGRSEFTQRVKAFKAGVVDFMTKPFTQSMLVRKLEKLHARSGRSLLSAEAGLAPQRVEADAPPPRQFMSFDDVPDQLRRVLIVDDDEEYRRFVRSFLEPFGFTVLEAADGQAALDLALMDRPWLVLSDVYMPHVDGIELCRRFRSHALLRSLPFIFLSGFDDYGDRVRCLKAGADEFLPKDLSPRELMIRIRLVLQRLLESAGWTRGSGMQGEMEVIGPAGVLQMCHLSRLTGVFRVRHADEEIEIRFRDGEVVGAVCGPTSGPDAVFEFLSWDAGRFEFRPGDPGPGEPLDQSLGALLLEGCRRLDEAGAKHR